MENNRNHHQNGNWNNNSNQNGNGSPNGSSGQSSSWIHNPALKNIDASKLQMLLSMADQGKGKSQNELLPFLMAAASNSRSGGASFSQEEADLILDVLKQGKSPEEIAKIDRVRSLVQMMKSR